MSDGIFTSFRVSAMGLRAQRVRLDVAAENLANLETTRTAAGGPYRPQVAVMEMGRGTPQRLGALPSGTVSFRELLATREGHLAAGAAPPAPAPAPGPTLTVRVTERAEPFVSEYQPDHPDADEDGMVLRPNVDPIQEMMTLIKATRAYEANATALDAAKEMLNRALEI
jgi:flagellar basal-body rod protein FlgC